MPLYMVIGDRGTGKNVFMTYNLLKDTRQFYSNYFVQSERYNPLHIEDIVTINNGIIAGDEFYTFIDSRASTSKASRYASYVLNQSRKDANDFLTAAQLFGSIDLRYREQSDYIVLCLRENDDKKFGNFIYKIYKTSNTNPKIKTVKITYDDATKHIFPFFRTDEKIPIPYDLIGDSIQDPRILLKMADRIVETMSIEGLPLEEFVKNRQKIIEYCIRHDPPIPKKVGDYVYTILKARF